MQYYSSYKSSEVLTQATTWVNLENIMLNERSQTHKDKILYVFIYMKPTMVTTGDGESGFDSGEGA